MTELGKTILRIFCIVSTIVWASALAYHLIKMEIEPDRAALIMAVYLGMWNALVYVVMHLRD